MDSFLVTWVLLMSWIGAKMSDLLGFRWFYSHASLMVEIKFEGYVWIHVHHQKSGFPSYLCVYIYIYTFIYIGSICIYKVTLQ